MLVLLLVKGEAGARSAPMRGLSAWLVSSMAALAVCSASPAARADEPDGGLALVVGAAVNLAGLAVGGAVMASNHANDATRSAGWLTMEGSFTVAPFAAHAVVGEWGRGALFSVVPAGAMGGTAALFASVPGVLDQGTLEQQRWMWALFAAGQLVSVAGVIDASLAPWRSRKIVVAPSLGSGRAGLQIGGIF